MSATTSGLTIQSCGRFDLNALLRTTGQDVPDTRHIVRDLIIKYVNDIPGEGKKGKEKKLFDPLFDKSQRY